MSKNTATESTHSPKFIPTPEYLKKVEEVFRKAKTASKGSARNRSLKERAV